MYMISYNFGGKKNYLVLFVNFSVQTPAFSARGGNRPSGGAAFPVPSFIYKEYVHLQGRREAFCRIFPLEAVRKMQKMQRDRGQVKAVYRGGKGACGRFAWIFIKV